MLPSRLRGMARLHAAHDALVEFWLRQVSGLAPIAGCPLKSAFDDPNIRTAHSPQLYFLVFNWYQMLGKHSQNFKHNTQQMTKGRMYEVNWIRNPQMWICMYLILIHFKGLSLIFMDLSCICKS